MPARKGVQRAQTEYDIIRKKETLEKLRAGYKLLKNGAYRNKVISVYALSKKTGVARQTITKYPEIMDLLSKEKNPGVELKTAVVNTKKIYNIEQAISIIETLTDMYNKAKDNYNECMKSLSVANLKISRLMVEKKELETVIRRYRENDDLHKKESG